MLKHPVGSHKVSRALTGISLAIIAYASISAKQAYAAEDLSIVPAGVLTRWSSFENPSAGPGQAARENGGAKGHAFDSVKAGETKTLLDVKGSGKITRFWCTVSDRSTETLRLLKLRMYWDGSDQPAVDVPLGDFFGAMHHEPVTFENELFASPEGRSFNCYIPMPFRKSAKVALSNESTKTLTHLFYDIDCLTGMRYGSDALYFHATWRREKPTTVGKDFEILPQVRGRGRFLGAHICVEADPLNRGWWGEGEVKVYLDGDKEYPTLAGTGTEDYIGTGWGMKQFFGRYQGCFMANAAAHLFTFYRYHVPDPIYFSKSARVTIQQIGGTGKAEVIKMVEEGRPVKPVSVDQKGRFAKLIEPAQDLKSLTAPDDAWCNYYRQDDVSAVALFYLDRR